MFDDAETVNLFLSNVSSSLNVGGKYVTSYFEFWILEFSKEFDWLFYDRFVLRVFGLSYLLKNIGLVSTPVGNFRIREKFLFVIYFPLTSLCPPLPFVAPLGNTKKNLF